MNTLIPEERLRFEEFLRTVHWFADEDLVFQEERNCYKFYGVHLAYRAWCQSAVEEREACVRVLDDDADRQEKAWDGYIASGGKGPATTYHAIPRRYAEQIRNRGNTQ